MNRQEAIQIARDLRIDAAPMTGRALELFATRIEMQTIWKCAERCRLFGATLEVDVGENFAEEMIALANAQDV